MDTALLGLRVVLSLACVLGLIWFAGRKLQGTAGVRRQRSVPLSVLSRQSLGKGAGVALVEVAGRVLLLGVGEQGVRVLTEVDVPPAPAPAERTGEVREEIDLATLPVVPLADEVEHLAPAVVTAPAASVADAATDDDAAPITDADAVTATDAEESATDDAAPDGTAEEVAVPAGAAADSVEAPAEAPDGAADEDAATAAADASTDPADAPLDVPTPHAGGSARLAALAGLAASGSAEAGCTAPAGALSGSILSPDTWRRAADAVQRRAAR